MRPSISISVALCTFNGAEFIEDQLRSILEQELLPDEIVISDDGSADGTVELARAVLEQSTSAVGLVVTDGPQRGVTANFAHAVAQCSGDLIALCDQDDVWHPDRLSAAVPAFDDQSLLLQHSDAVLVDDNSKQLGRTLLESLVVSRAERQEIAAGRAFDTYLRRNLATGATVLLRRSLLESALPFPSTWVHDEWLALIAAATGRVELLDEALIDYRQHSGNQIGVASPSPRRRIARMLEARADRYAVLALRAATLLERLQSLDVDPSFIVPAGKKAAFEQERSRYPRPRFARLVPIFRLARGGGYSRFSSQGSLDVIRDLLQPA